MSGFTRVLLVRPCQQGAYPRGHPTPLSPCWIHKPIKYLDTSPLLDKATCFGIQNLLWLFHFSSNSEPTTLINWV